MLHENVTFGTTTLHKILYSYSCSIFKTILNILQRDTSWAWASSFEKTNKKNFKCFGLCPFLLLMKSLFVCGDDPSCIASLVIFIYFWFTSSLQQGWEQLAQDCAIRGVEAHGHCVHIHVLVRSSLPVIMMHVESLPYI